LFWQEKLTDLKSVDMPTNQQIRFFRQIIDLEQIFLRRLSPQGSEPSLLPKVKKNTWSPPSRQLYASALFLTMLFLLARPQPLVSTGSGYLCPLLEETINGIIIITLPSDIHGKHSLRVGWRNFFSSCAVVSVFGSGGK
jgi:hypothetical protein